MFTDLPEEQQLYHSLATVGTLLLQLGDVGKQFLALANSTGEAGAGRTNRSPSGEMSVSASSSMSQIPHSSSGESQEEMVLGSSPRLVEEGAMADKTTESVSTGVPGTPAGEQTSESVSLGSEKKNSEGGIEEDSSAKRDISPGNRFERSAGQRSPDEDPGSLKSVSESQVSSSSSLSKPDDNWSISFEQFLASMLTEGALVTYFEKIHNVSDPIAKMRNRRLITRQTSMN